MTNIQEQQKKAFEANMLDGDDVFACGKAMLSAEDVWEYIQEALKQNTIDTCTVIEEWMPKENNLKKFGNDIHNPVRYMQSGENLAIRATHKVIDKIKNEA